MKFSKWIESHFPSFESKVAACCDEVRSAAQVVDIDASTIDYALGINKGKQVKALSKESSGRCRVYLNQKDYEGLVFPHLVFINLRSSFSDPLSGKAIPAVVDCLSLLFERYKKDNYEVSPTVVEVKEKAQVADQTILVNEQRNWFGKLSPYTNKNKNPYFTKKGLSGRMLESENEVLNLRNGYNPRYGIYTAVPLRRVYSDHFQGFQRIFENGSKIMIRDFNPNGLCGYFSPSEAALDLLQAKAIIYHEGQANALLAHFMCKTMGLQDVVNIACLYVDNIPVIANDVHVHLPSCKKQLSLYDNDKNGVGKLRSQRAQTFNPNLKIDCFELNDLAEVVRAYGYKAATKQLYKILLKAFKE